MKTWPVGRTRIFLRWAALSLLVGLLAGRVRAEDPKITAVFGIAGHYRSGTWCPVTFTVQGPLDAFSGQAQVLANSDPNAGNYGGRGGNLALTNALFARPVSVSGSGPQRFVVYTRGIDPGRDSDVTVQLVAGRERGDGRVLAQSTNQQSNGPPAITGQPLSENDLFLVGFGGDPGAFTSLSGQKLSLAHRAGRGIVPDGPGVNPLAAASGFSPATAQVVEAVGADLPDKAAGYSGVDAFLLRSDAPLETLTEAQADALKGWVASGGRLIVCGGADPSRFASSFYTGLLPAGVNSFRPAVTVPAAGPVGALVLTPKPIPGVRVLMQGADQSPLIVTGPYGAGSVTFTAFDPTTPAFQTATYATPSLWHTLLTAGHRSPSSLLGYVAAREENYNTTQYGYYGPGEQLLSEAVMRAPSLDAPGTEVIGLFLLVYLIALVPVNYLILKRLDRKELAWVTIPLLVLLFAVGTFGVGYAAKGGTVFLNRAAIVETSSGQRTAGVFAELGLFSPHRTTYDITLPSANALAAIPNPGFSYGRRNSSEDAQTSGQTRFVETAEGVILQDTPVNMWAMRAFDSQATTDLGGTVDARLTFAPVPPMQTPSLSGSVTNRTPYDLSDCMVLYRGQWQVLGMLARGSSMPVSITTPAVTNGQSSGLDIPSLGGLTGQEDATGDISQRMRVALADYARSLGRQNSNYYNNTAPPAVFAPSPNEALFLGWSKASSLAGPSPRVDGHSVHENDISLLVVHLPVTGK